jgi:inhibitor of KinA sporulation pathway (predicted exonuclease)
VQQLVRPTETPITPFCTSLTGITAEAAASGVELSDAIARVEREVALMEGGGLGENALHIIVQMQS